MYKKARREKNLLKEFGKFLKSKRETAKLSQSDVARGLGYSSPQFISNFERGLCSPPLPALKKIVDFYKLSRKEVIELIVKQQRKYLEDYFGGSISGRSLMAARTGFGSSSGQKKLKKAS